MTTNAPIVLFVYNRPSHTRRTLEALAKNESAAESDLFIFCDGPKTPADEHLVRETRMVTRNLDGFKSITIKERNENLGLAQSIIAGVTEMVNRYGAVIVLEDDLVTSPYFLRYMNDGLRNYEHDERVISIHGYVYPCKNPLPNSFFIRGADCWGWATWKRGWDLFEPDGAKLLKEIRSKNLEYEFDFDGSYPFTRMLEGQISGKNDSWAIRWYASAFLADKLTLYPGQSLVQNVGMDGSGSHSGSTRIFQCVLSKTPIKLGAVPIRENPATRSLFSNFFRSMQEPLLRRIFRFIRRPLRRLQRGTGYLGKHIRRQEFTPEKLAIFTNPVYIARKGLYSALKKNSKYVRGRTLDVGSGTKPYQHMFQSTEYVGLEIDTPDNRRAKNADVFYDGSHFPFHDAEFDSVISNQVLEHVDAPTVLLDEIRRVLRPGGTLLLTVPFIWEEHEQPHDFRRFTSFGVEKILQEHGFSIVSHEKLSSDMDVPLQMLASYLRRIAPRERHLKLTFYVVFIGSVNLLSLLARRILPSRGVMFLDNLVIARRTT